MDSNIFVIILIIILILIKLFAQRENFEDCSQYGNNYNKCYNNGDCTIMIDLKGKAFCTKK